MTETFLITINQHAYSVTLEDLDDGQLRAVVDGRERVLDARRVGPGAWSLVEGTDTRFVEVAGTPPKLTVDVSHPDGEARQAVATLEMPASGRPELGRNVPARPGSSGAVTLRAPIPGKLVKVPVKVGERVKAGQTLMVLEAMKMENEIRAPHEATVVALHATEGTAVETGQDLVSLG